MAKLDPDNWKSAKDVMDERAAAALKRKRDDGEEENGEDFSIPENTDLEQPKAVQDAQAPKSKKQKVEGKQANQNNNTEGVEETEEERRRRKAEEKSAKKQRKQEMKAKAREKQQRQKAKKRELKSSETSQSKKEKNELQLRESIDLGEPTSLHSKGGGDDASIASSQEEQPEIFSPPHDSGTSSTSSIQPASIDETIKPQRSNTEPTPASTDNTTSQTHRDRLQAAISHFRAERKADGADGRAPKNRQELLEQRRQKEEQKKAAKKEQKRREKEEEARRQDEEIARRFSPGGSGSLLASPRSPMIGDSGSLNASSSNNFSFGRIAFEDGTHFDPTTTEAVEGHKKKGPRDTASELKAAQTKKNRLASLDEEKRLDIEEKDMWLNAKRRAHGEHVRDNTNLLKKALKRQQRQKKKSEREWNDRIEGVQRSQDARQKKRTENLAKRKEEKHAGGAKGKKVKRPGFEGSFKGRTGGKRKS